MACALRQRAKSSRTGHAKSEKLRKGKTVTFPVHKQIILHSSSTVVRYGAKIRRLSALRGDSRKFGGRAAAANATVAPRPVATHVRTAAQRLPASGKRLIVPAGLALRAAG